MSYSRIQFSMTDDSKTKQPLDIPEMIFETYKRKRKMVLTSTIYI